jgi:dTDP-4-amino-4,6-dideoxygalactose transaminase
VDPAPGERHSWFTYLITVLDDRRDRLAHELLEQKIYTTLRYHPLHLAGTFGPPAGRCRRRSTSPTTGSTCRCIRRCPTTTSSVW